MQREKACRRARRGGLFASHQKEPEHLWKQRKPGVAFPCLGLVCIDSIFS